MKIFFFSLFFLLMYSFSWTQESSKLKFIPNQGQVKDFNGNNRPDVLFSTSFNGMDVFLRDKGLSYLVSNQGKVEEEIHEKVEEFEEGKTKEEILAYEEDLKKKQEVKWHQIDVDFLGFNKNFQVLKKKKTTDYINYYNVSNPDGITHVLLFNLIQYKNVYDGIHVDFYGNEQGLEYDFTILPHSDPRKIQMLWKGGEVSLTKNGSLRIKTTLNDITETIPEAYQVIDGEKKLVKVSYKLKKDKGSGNGIVSFATGTYNKDYALIIDPWVTYYGGSGSDGGRDIKVDNNGNVYMVGTTASTTGISTPGSFKTTFSGGIGSFSYDGFVTKFSAAGTRIWATYYGGGQSDYINCVSIDGNNNVYVGGYTYSDSFIATPGSFKDTLTPTGVSTGFGIDGFLVKFSSAGTRLWATYYGGEKTDYINDIVVDNAGNVYIVGQTQSATGISILGSFKENLTVNTFGFGIDGFIAKFSPTGTRLWATYYGGDKVDYINSIDIDSYNNIYATGYTSSDTGITTIGTYQSALSVGTSGFGSDAFLVKFNTLGARIWGTYYGGSFNENSRSVAVDTNNNIYIAGQTTSSTGISTIGSFQSTFSGVTSGSRDAFLAKFNATGNIIWATYYGGSNHDYAFSVAVNEITNNAIISGDTYSSDLPVTSCAIQTSIFGTENGFVGQFNPDGSIYCSSYFGSQHEENTKLTTRGCYIYLTGYSPGGVVTTLGAHQTTNGGSLDGWIGQLYTNTCGLKTSLKTITLAQTNNSSICKPCNGSATISLNSTCLVDSLYTYTWSNGTNISSISDTFNTLTNLCAGNYWVELNINNACYTTRDTLFFTIIDTSQPVMSFVFDSVCVGLETSFSNTSTNLPTTVNYLWIFGDGTTSTVVNPTHVYSSAGVYTVVLIHKYGVDCVDTISNTIVVHEKPISKFTTLLDGVEYFSFNLDSICAYLFEDVEFKDYSSVLFPDNIANYLWFFGTESSTTLPNPTYAFRGIKIQEVSLIVTSNQGCKDTSSSIIKVCDDFNFNIPNTFTPNGDGLNDYFKHYGFGIDTKNYSLLVFNRWGELLFEATDFTPWDGTHKGQPVKNGVYIWKVSYKKLNSTEIFEKHGHVLLYRNK